MKYRDLKRRVAKATTKHQMREKKIWFVDTDEEYISLMESGKVGSNDIIFIEDIGD